MKHKAEKLSVAPIFRDGVVLQRDRVIKLWGSGQPGDGLRVVFQGSTLHTTVDSGGAWEIQLPPMPAGGPFELRVRGSSEELLVRDVCLGDVWLLGGQSNMELPVGRTLDLYAEEVAHAKNPWIRQFRVPMTYNFHEPATTIPGGSWESVNPQSVLEFSALGYFFALAHYEKYRVPVGLVQTAVGGTPAEAWISQEVLLKLGGYEEILDQCKDDQFVIETETREMERLQQWYHKLQSIDLGLSPKHSWSDPDLDDSQWDSLQVPGLWRGSKLETVHGSVWFRKTIDLPPELAKKGALLRLGAIVDGDETYLNGIQVGATEYKYPPRKYPVEPGVLREGANTLAIRVISNRGVGGFVPDKDYCLDYGDCKVDLTGEWKWKIGATMPTLPLLTFFQYKPSGVYNGMIAPLAGYAFRAVLWYQGESNTGAPEAYERLFTALIKNWRDTLEQPDLPFLFVQLPNFDPSLEGTPGLNWAKLREAQRRTLNLPHTGMAVSIDLGEATDLHPQNKKDLAHRLALVAQKLVFGEPVVAQGPICESIAVEDGAAVLTFRHAERGLRVRGESLGGFEVSGDGHTFQQAQGELIGNSIRIWNPTVPRPLAVRYAWEDNPRQANLYSAEGLPAPPFVLSVQE
ncbi:MAG: sialate O-acetylesterase [Bacillota bacterium]|jgi:sialate O-acetylesterase|nr:sialate O-acetylesterase [Bacillota bacterium]HHT90658.1 9-O-acetylesterase [Bacillota bacterium]